MRAQDAAPEGLLAGTSGGRINSGNAASIALPDLPPHVLAVLRREGVTDLLTWRKLGRRRRSIFGITLRTVRLLNTAAKEAKG